MNGTRKSVIPLLQNGLDKPFIEPSFHLHLWEEVIAICIEINTNSIETVIVLKLKNKKVNLHLTPAQSDLDFLRGIIGNEIAILKTEDCFLLRKITHNQQVQKNQVDKWI